ncbi:uncharacterized protein LOC116294318 [Actinia tenebrosa]|uniref:Uncharacterized protein LOC116294318 n=1 Tax=Actinia tenebrosa TaxID=6105 RepID=A0A6P8HYM8_ACTTE|nr:uncharacterized protein LOC116294318 [Actinia tenebrosa]
MKFTDLNSEPEAMPMLPTGKIITSAGSTTFLMHKAAKEGCLDVLQRCIDENKMAACMMDDKDFSPLHYAAQYNQTSVLTALIKAGVDVNIRGDGDITALHIAARYDSLEATEFLLSNGANTSIRCAVTGSTPLLVAVRMENPRIVTSLLSKNRGLVDDHDLQGMTALHLACMRGSIEICKILFQYGAHTSLSKRNEDGSTPIVFAAGSNDEGILSLLIDEAKKHNANMKELINGSEEDSTTPLLAAINAGNEKNVRLLTENAASVNTPGRKQCTPLHVAAMNGNVDIVKILLQKGANVDAQDAQGKAPLHRAASLGWLEVIRVLTHNKATLELKDEDGMTPLLCAILSGQVFAVKLLVSLGADVMARDNDRRTSLHIATINEHFLIMHVLLKGEKDLQNIPDQLERIPLHYAASGEDTRIPTTLIEHGSNCHFKDRGQATPLHVAAEKGTLEHVELILKAAPCSIHERDLHGNTALHLAALNRKRETCKILLRYGADVDSLDFQLQTPLFRASQSGSLPIIELLLEHHANPNHKDIVGNTALHIAAEYGNPTIAKAFLDKGVECSLNNQGSSCLDTAIASRASEVINTIVKHQRWEELIHVDRGGCAIMAKLISDFPEGASLVMDKCIRRSNHKPSDPDFSITFDFQLLDPGPDRQINPDVPTDKAFPQVLVRKESDGKRFFGLLEMVNHKRQELLVHPLASRLRRVKWKSFGALVYCFNFIMYALFAMLLTLFMLNVRGGLQLARGRKNLEGGCSAVTTNQQIVASFAFVISVLHFCKEIFQMYIQRLRYFTDGQNLFEICMYVFGLVFLVPYTFPGSTGLCTGRQGVIWRFGTVTIFMAYFNLILLTRNLSFIGLYVTMFIEVFKTLMKVMVMGMLFLLAFALVFYILFKEQDAFDGFGEALVKVMAMTIGELDYNTLLVDAENQNNTVTGAPLVPYPELSYIFVFFFIMTMPIVLMNLLVGLAVGDIEAIQNKAFLTRIGRHVEFLTDIEKQYPKMLLRWLYTPTLVIFPRRTHKSFWKLYVGKSLERFIEDDVDKQYDTDPIEEKFNDLKDEMSLMRDRMKIMMQSIEHQNQMLRSTVVTSRSSIAEDKEATTFVTREVRSVAMEENLSTESISLVAVSPRQAYELRNVDPGIPSRLQNEEKKDNTPRCILMAALHHHKDELNRIRNSEEGAIDMKDECGCSALHYAARHNDAHVISTLLDAGADINLKGPAGQTALHISARFNCVESTKVLLDNNADTTIPCDINSVPLHAASRYGYQEIVKLLLQSDPSVVNCKSTGCVTPLLLASLNREKTVCELLTEHKADITVVNVENKTPLHVAAAHGNIEVVKFLIDKASKQVPDIKDFIDKTDYEGNTALILASYGGHDEVVKELLQNGADPLIQKTSSKITALHVAAIGGNTAVMEYLLSYGAKIEALDSSYMTPLHGAAASNQASALKFLLDKGAKVDALNISGLTAFLFSVKQGNKQAAAALLEGGANIKATDMRLRTCFHYAIKFNALNVLEMLIEKDDGTLLEMKDGGLQTPLHYAAASGNMKIISLLLRNGSYLRARDADEATPLHIAASFGCVEATDLLARMSPKSINERDIRGRTPLHCAVQGGFRKTCAVLLDLCAMPTIRDLNRRTPLHVAAESRKLNCVKALLANPDTRILELLDIDENSALHLACRKGAVDIMKELLDANADVTVRNKEGKTCLDVAVDWELEDVAAALVQHPRWMEMLRIQGPDGHRPMKRLIEFLPSVAEIALNQCLEVSDFPSTHPQHSIKFDLVLLDPGPDDELSLRGEPFDGPATMVRYNREELLNHPVTQALLRYKWFAFGKVLYYLNFAVYLLFTILFSYFIIEERGRLSLFSPSTVNASSAEKDHLDVYPSSSTMSLAIVIAFFLCVQLLKEFYQLVMLRLSYLRESSNLIEVFLYTTTLIYIAPYLASKPMYYSPAVQWNAGVVALFLCYTDLLLYIRRIGNSGIYVSMYFEVLITFLNVLVVLIVVIFGSAVIFYVLMKEQDNFSSVPLSFVRTSVMMIGELDYTDMLSDNVVNKRTNPNTGAPYVPLPDITYTLFYLFMLIVPVLLMNLLVGLAVGDIDAIQKTASFSRLKDQAKFVEDTQKRYPRKLRRMLYRDELVIYPNSNRFFKSMLLAGTSIIDTEYIEKLCKLKSTDGGDDAKGNQEALRYERQKTKLRVLEEKVDQQNKLLMAIGQKLGINDMES